VDSPPPPTASFFFSLLNLTNDPPGSEQLPIPFLPFWPPSPLFFPNPTPKRPFFLSMIGKERTFIVECLPPPRGIVELRIRTPLPPPSHGIENASFAFLIPCGISSPTRRWRGVRSSRPSPKTVDNPSPQPNRPLPLPNLW